MRRDIDKIVREVEESGVCVVADFIPADLLTRIRAEVDRLNEKERHEKVAFLES